MKIGKEDYPGFVMKPLRSGMYYGWDASPRLRRAGWKAFKFEAADLVAALALWKVQDDKIKQWEAGGASPRSVKAYSQKQTFGALLDRYEREHLIGLATNTQRTSKPLIADLRTWAAKHPVAWITPQRVRALKLALCPQADQIPRLLRDGYRDIPGHSQAFKRLCMGRDIFAWAKRPSIGLAATNPFEDFELPKPPPRNQLWDRECEAAFTAAADDLGEHSIGFALRLAINFGQREADLLALTRSNWREITLEQLDGDRELYQALASETGPNAGKVMGFYLGQGKGKTAANPKGVQIGVPIAGNMRMEVEASIADATARAAEQARGGTAIAFTAMHLIVRDKVAANWSKRIAVGSKWAQRDFIEKVATVRDHAAKTAREAGDEELAERIEALQFLDTRRTCVTRLADLGMSAATIAGRTGHSLKTVENILKVYLVRTVAQAGRGTVALLADEQRRRRDQDEKKEGKG